MTNNFDPNQLTTWGQRMFNGPNGTRLAIWDCAGGGNQRWRLG